MKTILIFLMITVCPNLYSMKPVPSDKPALDSVQTLEQYPGIYKVGDFYL